MQISDVYVDDVVVVLTSGLLAMNLHRWDGSPGHGNNGTRFFCVRVFFSLLFIYFQRKCVVVVTR